MKKTIKIIDLLNKIANGEEVPKRIKYENDTYIHIGNYCYYCDETNLILSDRLFAEYSKLNEEVEIIEEDKWNYTIRQISKMIASGDLKDIYTKYLSNCPIGFMKEEDIYNYILKNEEVEILDEEEFEDIEELEIKQNGNLNYYIENEYGTKCSLTKHSKIIADKINQLIKNQKLLIEKIRDNK